MCLHEIKKCTFILILITYIYIYILLNMQKKMLIVKMHEYTIILYKKIKKCLKNKRNVR